MREGVPSNERPIWPATISRSIELSDRGLVCGARSVLARMADDRQARLALDTDGPRLIAMLSVAFGRPVGADILAPLGAAAAHWQRGDKALANLRLIFADLPKLQEPADAYRLCLAEHLLDAGMAPKTLMKELEIEPASFGKDYHPDEPRVPAGNGRRSGEWDFGGRTNTPDQGQGRIVVAVEGDPTDDKKNLEEPAHHHGAGQLPEDERGFQLNPLPGLPLPGGKSIPIGGDPVSEPQATPTATPAIAVIRANAARGAAAEQRILEELSLPKNTIPVRTTEGVSIPDALNETQVVEIKDSAYVSATRQVRIQTEAATNTGRESVLITGEKTRVSKPASDAYDRIIHHPDLGPR